MQLLQEILFVRSEIGFSQGELEPALKSIQEAVELDDGGPYYKKSIQLMADIRKGLYKRKHLQKFTGKTEEVEKLIIAKNFAIAKSILQDIERMELEIGKKQKLKQLWQYWKKQKRQEKFLHYRFFQAKELGKFSPKKPVAIPKNVFIQRIALINTVEQKATGGYFFTIAKGHLYCLYANSGRIKWVEFLGDNALFYPIFLAGPREHFNMEFIDKILVVSTVENTIKLLEAENGKEIWQTQMPGIICAQPQLFKRKIYVGCLNRHLYTLEIQTGKITGAFRCDSVPQYPPSFDKRLKLMYLSGRDHIYVYHFITGKLLYILPYTNEPCAPPLAISPYLCTFTSLQTKTLLQIYHKQRKFKLLKTIEIPGVMNSPATISSGILAIATNKRLGLFGINPAKSQEAIFSLTGTDPLFNSSKGPVFMQFSDFGRRLLVAQNSMRSYSIKEFTSSNNVVEKNWSEKITEVKKKTYLPIKRSQNVFFVANHIANKHFYGKAIEVSPEGSKVLWQREFALSVITEATLALDGRMFLTSHEGSIHEVFLNENKEICYRVLVKKITSGTAPVLYIPKGDGQLLALGKNRSLYMLDSVTGWHQENWKTDIVLKGELGLGACFGKGSVFFSAGKGVFAISAKTGLKNYLEYSEFRGKPFSTIPLFYNNSIIIGNDNGKLYSIKPTPGQPVAFLQKQWDFPTNGAIRSNPVIEANIAYFGSDDHSLYALDLANHANAKWYFATGGPVRSKPTIGKDRIYFGSGDRHIYALKKNNGKLLWKKKLDGQIMASVLVKNLRVYVGTVTGNFYAIDSERGTILWRYRLGGRVLSSPVLLGEKILVAANDGFLYSILDNFESSKNQDSHKKK